MAVPDMFAAFGDGAGGTIPLFDVFAAFDAGALRSIPIMTMASCTKHATLLSKRWGECSSRGLWKLGVT